MRIWIRIAIIVVIAGILWCWPLITNGDPSPLPPHAARPTAGVATEPLPLAVAGADTAMEVVVNLTAWAEGVARHEQEVAAAEAARVEAARRAGSTGTARAGSVPGQCDGIAWAIPVELVIKESKCSFDAQSPQSFCGGHGCVGAYQFDSRHWDPNSWGGCADLGDWRDPEAQHECARRLSSDGTNLGPWGG